MTLTKRALGFAVLIVACSGDPLEPGRTGSIMGTVADAFGGGPLSHVTIEIGGRIAQTGSDGRYDLTGVPAGAQSLTATKEGYQQRSGSATVVTGETRVIDISLIPVSGPPSLIAESGNEPGQIHLGWVARPDAESYILYWSTTPGVTPSSGARIPDIQETSYDHSGLTPGSAYYYVLATVQQGVEGPATAEVSATAGNGIRLKIQDPGAGVVADTSVQATVLVTSVFQLVSVTATVEDRVTPLSFLSNPDRWHGNVSLTGLHSPRSRTLTFTATDVHGTVATASQSFEHNRRAVVRIESPLPGVVAQSQLRLRVSCEDDAAAACANLKLGANTLEPSPSPLSQDLADGVTQVDQDVSLAMFDGRVAVIGAQGTDDLGRNSFGAVIVYVDVSPRLTKVAEVAGVGAVIDASADRLLVLDTLSNRDLSQGSLRIQDRATGLLTNVLTRRALEVHYSQLTPQGAVFEARDDGSNFIHLYEWNNGTLVDLGVPAGLAFDSPYLAWHTFNGAMHRRNLESGITIDVPDADESVLTDVGPNGDVVYRSLLDEIKRFRDGLTTTLVAADPDLQNGSALTDGVNVCYSKATPNNPPFGLGQFKLLGLTESGIDTLVSLQEWPLRDTPDPTCAVSGGWIAFTQPATGGAVQVWVRDPAGSRTQISFFSGISELEALSSDGRIVFSRPSGSAARRRYLWTPGGSAVEIGSGLGRPKVIDGLLHVMLGNMLLRVD
jgi:hypothetical protein